jgi:predicted alpha/beta superfamily hydrolase
MTRLVFILGLVAALALALYAGWRVHRWRQTEEERRLRKAYTLAGNVHFRSRILGGERRIWVYLPPTYDEEPDRRFPVLYMQDGQNVFDDATAFVAGKEWDETAQELIEEGKIESLIIVAVDDGDERRTDEYTAAQDRHGHGGDVNDYARMLVEELKPWVDEAFRTRPGREDTGIAGSSYGALASLWIGLTYSDVFGKIAALSTPANRHDGQIIRLVEGLAHKPATLIWMDMGTREGSGDGRAARRLRDALVAKGWQEGVDLTDVEAERAAHDETAWAKRLPAVLEFLFPPRDHPGEAPEGADA